MIRYRKRRGVVIKFNSAQQIPENLVARARIVKSNILNTTTLPKAAILSNETQTEFWVMMLINPTTAVKIPVKEGIQAGDRIQILSPKFSINDKIILTGNYGLSDTAKVKVITAMMPKKDFYTSQKKPISLVLAIIIIVWTICLHKITDLPFP